MDPFTPDQLGFLESYVSTVVRAAVGAGAEQTGERPGRKLWPATVVSYNAGPGTGALPGATAGVEIDGDPAPKRAHEAQVLIAAPLVVGERVMVEFDPPLGIFVVGFYGQPPEFLARVQLSNEWVTCGGVIPFDCVTFADGIDVINAGTEAFYLECPTAGTYAVSCQVGIRGTGPDAPSELTGIMSIDRLDGNGDLLDAIAAAVRFEGDTGYVLGLASVAVPVPTLGRLRVSISTDFICGSGLSLSVFNVDHQDNGAQSHLEAVRVARYIEPVYCDEGGGDG